MEISTITELDNWMSENCIKNIFTPGNRYATDDGVGLEKIGDLYVWYHCERGEQENLKYFDTEKDAAEFVYEYVRTDKYANSHLVGQFRNRDSQIELIRELINRNLKYWNDSSNSYFRVFVYRCDIKKVTDLKEKHLNEK